MGRYARPTGGDARLNGGPVRYAAHRIGPLNITCADCHRSVTSDGANIVAPALHVDKRRQTTFPAGFTYDPATRRCTGSCHGENHNDTW